MPDACGNDLLEEPARNMRNLWVAVFREAISEARRNPEDRWLRTADARTVAALAGIEPDLAPQIAARVRPQHEAAAEPGNGTPRPGAACVPRRARGGRDR
ncbi:hypothetical protein [Rhodobaculum claviforme]|uniref:hypothetical protein n=1 Tax=Rhodobaculum claviforme TaxID=1549854 RepID=UPI00191347A3|nr:hypothetical protein [Rhodobaculum claviforme]